MVKRIDIDALEASIRATAAETAAESASNDHHLDAAVQMALRGVDANVAFIKWLATEADGIGEGNNAYDLAQAAGMLVAQMVVNAIGMTAAPEHTMVAAKTIMTTVGSVVLGAVGGELETDRAAMPVVDLGDA